MWAEDAVAWVEDRIERRTYSNQKDDEAAAIKGRKAIIRVLQGDSGQPGSDDGITIAEASAGERLDDEGLRRQQAAPYRFRVKDSPRLASITKLDDRQARWGVPKHQRGNRKSAECSLLYGRRHRKDSKLDWDGALLKIASHWSFLQRHSLAQPASWRAGVESQRCQVKASLTHATAHLYSRSWMRQVRCSQRPFDNEHLRTARAAPYVASNLTWAA